MLERVNQSLEMLRRSERKVADVVLADPHGVVQMTLAGLADAAKVSQPTIVRFANAIGCDGFHDFRIQLAQSVALGIPATQSVIDAGDDIATTVSKIFDFSITSLDHVRRHLDLRALDLAVAALSVVRARVVFIGLGASGIVAMDAEQKFPLFGVPCAAPVDTHQQFLAASISTPATVLVAISNTGRTISILDTVRVARDRGATVIAITGGQSPLAELSSIALIVESLDNTDVYTPTISRLAQLVVVDTLATMVLLRRGESALEDIRTMKSRLSQMRSGAAPRGRARPGPAGPVMTDVALAFDLGTGGCKAALVDLTAQVVGTAIVSYPTTYPAAGWHEQRPAHWWDAVVRSARELLAADGGRHRVIAVALSGHSLAMVPVDADGRSLLDSVPIWSDTRGEEVAAAHFATADEADWYGRTGNGFPRGMYTVFKAGWLRATHPDLAARTVRILGSKDWINARLTGVQRTDPSYASGSGAYDLHEPADAARRAGRPRAAGPVVAGGRTVDHGDRPAHRRGLGRHRPARRGAGGGRRRGQLLHGARCRAGPRRYRLHLPRLVQLGDRGRNRPGARPGRAAVRLRPCAARSLHLGTVHLRRRQQPELAGRSARPRRRPGRPARRGGQRCRSARTGLTCVPTLAGGTVAEGGPGVRGAFLGLDLGHTHGDLARALVEGIGFSLADAARSMLPATPAASGITVIGGGARSRLMLQVLADLVDRPLHRPDAAHHGAALGAAALALLGTGAWPDTTALATARQAALRVAPRPELAVTYALPRARFDGARAATRAHAEASDTDRHRTTT